VSAANDKMAFEAEALATLERALNHVRATALELAACERALIRGGVAGARDLGKVIELHRLAGVRLEVFARRLGSGRLSDECGGGMP